MIVFMSRTYSRRSGLGCIFCRSHLRQIEMHLSRGPSSRHYFCFSFGIRTSGYNFFFFAFWPICAAVNDGHPLLVLNRQEEDKQKSCQGTAPMTCRVLCTCCYRMFTFNPQRVPAQRAHTKGCRKPGQPVAYYPSCTYCREQVEVAASTVSTSQSMPARAS